MCIAVPCLVFMDQAKLLVYCKMSRHIVALQLHRVQWVQKVTEEIQVRREMMVTQDREEALASPETTVLQYVNSLALLSQ